VQPNGGPTCYSAASGAGSAIDLAAKDIDLALELADELSVPVEIGAAARAPYAAAQALGWGPESMLRVVQALEQQAGVQLRASDSEPE
jgi:3-hydroxyisobutyrate dehydrogenase-like beta-hydroxyacid dehydrogenase